MRSPINLSPGAQLMLDYLREHWQADQFDIQQNLGMRLSSALVVADELHAQGYPVEVSQARLTYFSYTKGG